MQHIRLRYKQTDVSSLMFSCAANPGIHQCDSVASRMLAPTDVSFLLLDDGEGNHSWGAGLAGNTFGDGELEELAGILDGQGSFQLEESAVDVFAMAEDDATASAIEQAQTRTGDNLRSVDASAADSKPEASDHLRAPVYFPRSSTCFRIGAAGRRA
eukprot:6809273-Alexandrium_andersonii.AAC.1